MSTTLIVILLALALLVIVALPSLRRKKTDDAAPPALSVRSAKPADLHDVKSTPLYRWLCEQACAQTGMDLRNDPMALTRIAEAAKKAQAEIDAAGSAEISLPYICADASGPKHLELRITREQASALKRPLL